MRKRRSAELLPLDPEIERTLCQLRQENRRKEDMSDGENMNNQIQALAKALRDYAVPTVMGSAIRRPAIQANNFKLKPSLIQMVEAHQFGGYLNETPDEHIAKFL